MSTGLLECCRRSMGCLLAVGSGLSAKLHRGVGALERQIRTIGAPDERIFRQIAAPLRALTGSELCVSYRVEEDATGIRVPSAEVDGDLMSDAEMKRRLRAAARGAGRAGWTAYDPLAPEPAQQNRACTPMIEGRLLPAQHYLRFGAAPGVVDSLQRRFDRHWRPQMSESPLSCLSQTRVLLCHDGALLAWFGLITSAGNQRERELVLQRITSALRDRLRLETWAEEGRSRADALHGLLEALPAPAVIATPGGRVVATNAAARDELDRADSSLRGEIADSLRGRGPLRRSILSERGTQPRLLLHREPGTRHSDAERASLARDRWGLSPRQAETLKELSRGASNQAIARALGCSRRTVEKHVAALMEKLEVDTRAALVARYWMLAP